MFVLMNTILYICRRKHTNHHVINKMSAAKIKEHLSKELLKEHAFWSYEPSSLQDIPDEILIEKVLVHLDLQDIDLLFSTYPFEKIKKVWREQMVPQGDYYHTLNRFLAWWYFHIKNPDAYLKAMNTRKLNQLLK